MTYSTRTRKLIFDWVSGGPRGPKPIIGRPLPYFGPMVAMGFEAEKVHFHAAKIHKMMPNNEHLPKQTQQKKIMEKYKVVQKLWGF